MTRNASLPDLDMLDATALERLRELDPDGHNKLLERVFAAFEASTTRLLPQFEAARASADWPTVRQVSHTLKSSSASIGALALSQCCADVESRVRLGQTEGLEAHLDGLRDELQRVLSALRRFDGRTA